MEFLRFYFYFRATSEATISSLFKSICKIHPCRIRFAFDTFTSLIRSYSEFVFDVLSMALLMKFQCKDLSNACCFNKKRADRTCQCQCPKRKFNHVTWKMSSSKECLEINGIKIHEKVNWALNNQGFAILLNCVTQEGALLFQLQCSLFLALCFGKCNIHIYRSQRNNKLYGKLGLCWKLICKPQLKPCTIGYEFAQLCSWPWLCAVGPDFV